MEDNIQELCDNYLSFLKDKGFTVEYSIFKQSDFRTDLRFVLVYKGSNIYSREIFNIEEIKDDFIPFLFILIGLKKLKGSLNLGSYKANKSTKIQIVEGIDIEEFLNDKLHKEATVNIITLPIL